MPHVDTIRVHAAPRPAVRRARLIVDPALWAWAVVALMALLPLHAALAAA